MLVEKGIHVRSFNQESKIEQLPVHEVSDNIEKIKANFSTEVLIQQSAEVFSFSNKDWNPLTTFSLQLRNTQALPTSSPDQFYQEAGPGPDR